MKKNTKDTKNQLLRINAKRLARFGLGSVIGAIVTIGALSSNVALAQGELGSSGDVTNIPKWEECKKQAALLREELRKEEEKFLESFPEDEREAKREALETQNLKLPFKEKLVLMEANESCVLKHLVDLKIKREDYKSDEEYKKALQVEMNGWSLKWVKAEGGNRDNSKVGQEFKLKAPGVSHAKIKRKNYTSAQAYKRAKEIEKAKLLHEFVVSVESKKEEIEDSKQ